MDEILRSWIPWGASIILWVQQFTSGAADALFTVATYLGREEFYILFLPIVYWCVNKGWGRALAVIFLFSEYVNGFVKETFAIPRPYYVDPRIRAPLPETSFAFPSSHAQGAMIVWGFLAAQVRKAWFWALAGALIFVISLSRIYLGVHYPQDILGGWVLGIVLLGAFLSVRSAVRGRLSIPMPVQLGAAIVIPVVLFAVHPSEGAALVTGVGCGMLVGFVLEAAYVRFRADGLWWKRVVRFVVGVVPLVALYAGLKMVFPEGEAFRFLRYAIVGLWAGWLAPWTFVALRLADRETPAPTVQVVEAGEVEPA